MPSSISYRSLPHKSQLFILLLARFTEPLITSSIQSYIFFQLKYFGPTASTATIAAQSGLIISCKTAAHVCTGLIWGRLADWERVGRKAVLVFGLLASSLATIGYGFSASFQAAITWQILDGALNSTIAMVRCMTAELNPDKRHRIRALTLLPLFANIGSLLGPLIGGFLAPDKASSALLARHPYAAPNILVGGIQTAVALGVVFWSQDTLERKIMRNKGPNPRSTSEGGGTNDDFTNRGIPNSLCVSETSQLLSCPDGTAEAASTPRPPLAFRHMWTSNVVLTMLAHFVISGHLGTFSSLWAVFLSTSLAKSHGQHLPFHFSGGVGLEPRGVGIAMSFIGFAGILIQVLLYPVLQDRFGTIRLWRVSLFVCPIVYVMAPFCAPIASFVWGKEETETPPSLLIWVVLLLVVLLFVAGRTGVVPATSLLINDCTPHPSVRGTVHTTAVIVSNLSRAIFPPLALAAFGYGQQIRTVGLGFWVVAVLAALSCVASQWVREGRNGE